MSPILLRSNQEIVETDDMFSGDIAVVGSRLKQSRDSRNEVLRERDELRAQQEAIKR